MSTSSSILELLTINYNLNQNQLLEWCLLLKTRFMINIANLIYITKLRFHLNLLWILQWIRRFFVLYIIYLSKYSSISLTTATSRTETILIYNFFFLAQTYKNWEEAVNFIGHGCRMFQLVYRFLYKSLCKFPAAAKWHSAI